MLFVVETTVDFQKLRSAFRFDSFQRLFDKPAVGKNPVLFPTVVLEPASDIL